jgi:hypothetical protein
VNVQTVPDIHRQQVRVVAEIEGDEDDAPFAVEAEVRAAKSGKAVGRLVIDDAREWERQHPSRPPRPAINDLPTGVQARPANAALKNPEGWTRKQSETV